MTPRSTGVRLGALPLRTLGLTLGLTLAQAAHAQSFASYDTFGTTNLSAARWYGEEGKQYGGTRTEARRAIVDGQLRIEARTYSDSASDSGVSTGRNSLLIMNPSQVVGMRATLTTLSTVTGTCSGNTAATLTRGRMFGFFFNAGMPIPGSNYNDVFAGIQAYRASNSTDGSGVLRVSAFVGQCTDDSCIGSTTLASQDLGTVNVNTPVILELLWDPANNRFTFKRDAQAAVNLAYTVADAQPAAFPVKRLEVSNTVPHCTSSRPNAFGSVNFDNVSLAVNPALASAQQASTVMAEPEPAADAIVGHVH